MIDNAQHLPVLNLWTGSFLSLRFDNSDMRFFARWQAQLQHYTAESKCCCTKQKKTQSCLYNFIKNNFFKTQQ